MNIANQPKFTIDDLIEQFPDDDTFLLKLFDLRYGEMEDCVNCGVVQPNYVRVRKRKCYECSDCLFQIYPMAGTPLENSKTKLTTWFHIIFLFACFKNGVSAKEILLPIIRSSILAGTTIFSDEYKGYRDLKVLGYDHATVNHTKY